MTDAPRCATCRHWHVLTGDPGQADYGSLVYLLRRSHLRTLLGDEHSYGDVVTPPYPVGSCESPQVPFYTFPAEDGATTLDGSEYTGMLVTGHKFGCVQHAAT